MKQSDSTIPIAMIYLDNPYRLLGLFATSSRSQVWDAFQRLRIGSDSSIEGDEFDDPLSMFGAMVRDESSLKRGFEALNDRRERLRSRIFWFTMENDRDAMAIDALRKGDSGTAISLWNESTDVRARANLVRLLHLLKMQRADNRVPSSDKEDSHTWRALFDRWGELIGSEEFWKDCADIETASEFFPTATPYNFESLRKEMWEMILSPSRELLDSFDAGKEYGRMKEHLVELYRAGAPPALIERLQQSAFAPLMLRVGNLLNENHDDLTEAIRRQSGSAKEAAKAVWTAYERYRSQAHDEIIALMKRLGSDFPPVMSLRSLLADHLAALAAVARQHDLQIGDALIGEAAAMREGVPIEWGIERPATKVKFSLLSLWHHVPGIGKLVVIPVLVAIGLLTRGWSGSVREEERNHIPDSVARARLSFVTPLEQRTLDSAREAERLSSLAGGKVETGMIASMSQQKVELMSFKDPLLRHADSLEDAVRGVEGLSKGYSEGMVPLETLEAGLARARMSWFNFSAHYSAYLSSLGEYNHDVRIFNARLGSKSHSEGGAMLDTMKADADVESLYRVYHLQFDEMRNQRKNLHGTASESDGRGI